MFCLSFVRDAFVLSEIRRMDNRSWDIRVKLLAVIGNK
jgi:hypothetical protein